MTIVDLVQEMVDAEVKAWKDTTCPPVFTVSTLGSSLILTINHMQNTFSEVIFPEDDMTYGLQDLFDLVNNMYNRTM